MAQVAIREYDAKSMFARYTHTPYLGVLISEETDIDTLGKTPLAHTYPSLVTKPDQLFGKRGKYGLVGVKLDVARAQKWLREKNNTEVTIGTQTGKLTTFLVEPFVPHTEEYYVAIKTERDHDVMYFSTAGGIEVEENWEKVQELKIPLEYSWQTENRWAERTYPKGISNATELQRGSFFTTNTFGTFGDKNTEEKVYSFLEKLYSFFVECGFAYLEINPFTFDADGNVVCLDMVARVDNTEAFRQKSNWGDLPFPHPFGPEKSEWEKYIEKLDSETGASLKFRILNPQGRIWLLTSGGGASVIIADTLGDLGYAGEIGNYGECSGNPDRENTRAYTMTLLSAMLAHRHEKWPKYLIIAGAIANFTHIDKTFAGVIDAFEAHIDAMREQDVRILVRRGGINDTKWLLMMKDACEKLELPCDIADGGVYMTDILKKITF